MFCSFPGVCLNAQSLMSPASYNFCMKVTNFSPAALTALCCISEMSALVSVSSIQSGGWTMVAKFPLLYTPYSRLRFDTSPGALDDCGTHTIYIPAAVSISSGVVDSVL